MAKYGRAVADFAGFVAHDGPIPGFNSFTGYQSDKDVIIITAKNVYSAPDCTSPATEITELILKELAGDDREH
jgi:hypothetical protein